MTTRLTLPSQASQRARAAEMMAAKPIAPAGAAGDLGVQPVPGPDELVLAIQRTGRRQGEEVLGGEGIERRHQLAHHAPPRFDQMFEFYAGADTCAA